MLLNVQICDVYFSLNCFPSYTVFFRYVLGDLEIAYKMYVPSVEELCQQNPHHNLVYKMDSVETVILFHLRALADLGKQISFSVHFVLYLL